MLRLGQDVAAPLLQCLDLSTLAILRPKWGTQSVIAWPVYTHDDSQSVGRAAPNLFRDRIECDPEQPHSQPRPARLLCGQGNRLIVLRNGDIGEAQLVFFALPPSEYRESNGVQCLLDAEQRVLQENLVRPQVPSEHLADEGRLRCGKAVPMGAIGGKHDTFGPRAVLSACASASRGNGALYCSVNAGRKIPRSPAHVGATGPPRGWVGPSG